MTANVGRASSAHQRALEPCPGAEKKENKNLQSDTGIFFQPNTKKHLCRWFASSIVQPIKHGNGASLVEKNVFSFFMQSSSMPLALLLSSIASNYADFASSRARALSSIFFLRQLRQFIHQTTLTGATPQQQGYGNAFVVETAMLQTNHPNHGRSWEILLKSL